MIAAAPRPSEISFVCHRLREQSAEEMFMLSWHDSPEALAQRFINLAGFQWVAYDGTEPAAIFGAHPLWPGTWSLYGFGTDRYGNVLREVTKHFRREVVPAVRGSGAHRAQCMSPAHHTETHRWLEMLGGSEEATLRCYGRRGEDMKIFAWFKETA
ncbi:hypothetical protein [uncultured Amaricoccus sp.]|uniref:hypothetical protein n=1 Tax=uncultured Amaricoccus sp. TaxID=339341 RepID=UPI0026170C6A|nr:hypothetical protein [uncultured Amaricoccus sp.]